MLPDRDPIIADLSTRFLAVKLADLAANEVMNNLDGLLSPSPDLAIDITTSELSESLMGVSDGCAGLASMILSQTMDLMRAAYDSAVADGLPNHVLCRITLAEMLLMRLLYSELASNPAAGVHH